MDVLTFGRLRHLSTLDWWLLLISIAGSAVYYFTRGVPPFPVGGVLKALAIAPLGLLAFRVLEAERAASGGSARIRDSHLLAAALTLSCVGDVLLYLGSRRYFGPALSAFLVAHVAYIVLFTRSWPRPLRLRPAQRALAGVVILYSVAVLAWIAIGTRLGPLMLPVLLYGIVITAMALAAILAGFTRPWISTGALLFVLSLIAVAVIERTWRLAFGLVWPTYYLAQYGIAVGVLREKVGKC